MPEHNLNSMLNTEEVTETSNAATLATAKKTATPVVAAAAPAVPDLAKPNTLDLSKLGSSASQGHQVVPHYGFNPGMVSPTPAASATGVENNYFNPRYTALTNDQAQQMYPGFPSSSYTAAATGGLMAAYADGGSAMGRNPVEQMSNQNAIGANTGFPQAYIHNNAFATPTQTPISQNVLTGPGDTGVDSHILCHLEYIIVGRIVIT